MSIKLVSNPSTGYSWGKPENIAHLKLISAQSEKGSTDRMGAAGFQVFSLKATEPGESRLVLGYARPFEKNTPAVKTFHLAIRLKREPPVKRSRSLNLEQSLLQLSTPGPDRSF